MRHRLRHNLVQQSDRKSPAVLNCEQLYTQREDPRHRIPKLTQKKDPISTTEDAATTPSLISSESRSWATLAEAAVAISAAFLTKWPPSFVATAAVDDAPVAAAETIVTGRF